METEEDLRQRRVAINKELGELIPQAQDWWLNWVKPNAAEARMLTTGGKTIGKQGASTKPIDIKLADQLDISTPTGKFEKGRAYMAYLDVKIRALHAEEEKLAAVLNDMHRERNRRARAAGSERVQYLLFDAVKAILAPK